MAAPQSLNIRVQTLTPVWTGDAEGKTSYIKGTSLVGGMRFWAEALLRSLGGRVCNITEESSRCIYDPEKKRTRICSACEVFGCTGMARSFMLRVMDEKLQGKKMPSVKLDIREYQKRNYKKVPRYLDGKPGLSGNFTINLSPVRPGGIHPVVAASLLIMLRWGALGARDQYGFGFCRKDGAGESLKVQALAVLDMPEGTVEGKADMADLRDFFFFTAEAQYRDDNKPGRDIVPSSYLPFVMRHDTRNRLRRDKPLRHYFGGSIMGDKQGTQYNIALAGNTLYGWGWFPRKGRFSKDRDRSLNALRQEVSNHSVNSTLKWKEFSSKRDNCNSAGNWPDFLNELLTTTWR